MRPPDRTGTKHTEQTKQKISESSKGKLQSPSHRAALTKVRQRMYSILDPRQQRYIVQSGQLPKFCKDHSLNYSNLMNAKNKGNITYKGGWILTEIDAIPKPIARATKPGVDF